MGKFDKKEIMSDLLALQAEYKALSWMQRLFRAKEFDRRLGEIKEREDLRRRAGLDMKSFIDHMNKLLGEDIDG